MKTLLVIVLVLLIVVSTLAVMNNACKTGLHEWRFNLSSNGAFY